MLQWHVAAACLGSAYCRGLIYSHALPPADALYFRNWNITPVCACVCCRAAMLPDLPVLLLAVRGNIQAWGQCVQLLPLLGIFRPAHLRAGRHTHRLRVVSGSSAKYLDIVTASCPHHTVENQQSVTLSC